ncbi:GNAT family N-acetyltransferase [Deinococcus sp. QL22]|uniref:GNAT family N-acetyltransferase n=1 Tax=Deinococcus sp. QL22 TaxID=2939437 RepID=UPI0020181426|nr:GNAT family N-acetyltransferase [Deinococcus sp. QL22]UQN07279.1 GNAT family N-acetyltransferase [Deinococcus sp. QL22]
MMDVTVRLDGTLLTKRQQEWAQHLANPAKNPLLPTADGRLSGDGFTLQNELCVYSQLQPQYAEGLLYSGLIVTKRPCATVFDLTPKEAAATHELLAKVKAHLDATVQPDGYTVGWNVNPAGGQHIPHVHLHVIPRWNTDAAAGVGLRWFFRQVASQAQEQERRRGLAEASAPAAPVPISEPEGVPMTATELTPTPAVLLLTQQHVKLREALPADFSVILDLLTRCGLHTSSLTPEGSTYWIADLNGVPGGCIGLEHGQGVCLIRSTAVLPESRSQGLGRALVRSALTQASLRGDHTVYLFSQEAGDYWRRFGFVPTGGDELSAALPDAPQVKSGLCRGWIHEEQAWKLELVQQENAGQ